MELSILLSFLFESFILLLSELSSLNLESLLLVLLFISNFESLLFSELVQDDFKSLNEDLYSFISSMILSFSFKSIF